MSLVLERPPVAAKLRFDPVTPALGADVSGIDLRQELDETTVARLREALLKYKVLFFRDQPIDDAQQIRFSRYFGPVTPAHPITNGLHELPEIKINTLEESRREYRPFRLDAEHPLRPLSRAVWPRLAYRHHLRRQPGRDHHPARGEDPGAWRRHALGRSGGAV